MSRAAPWLLLGVLVAGFGAAKAHFDPHVAWGTDGCYFLQLARHVGAGDGLVSSVSLYHQGLRDLPQRVNQSPAWPLLLGLASRPLGVERAGSWVPEILFLLDLLLLHLLGRRIWRRVAGPAPLLPALPCVDFGHVAVLLFGSNVIFFRFTSLPYTEAFAFGLAFAALLCVDSAVDRRSGALAALTGALAAICVLTRGQMLAILVALPAALCLTRRWRLPTAAAAGSLLAFAPWSLYVASWADTLNPAALLGFSVVGDTPRLEPFGYFVATSGPLDYLRDRAGGLAVAFDPRHRFAYFASFGGAVLFAPVGLLAAAGALRAETRRAWLQPEAALVWALLLCGAGMLAPVHHAHATYFKEWMFGHRHGLPLVFLLLPAIAWAISHPRPLARGLAGVVLGAVLVHGLVRLGGETSRVLGPALRPAELEFLRWLDARRGTPTVLATRATLLAPFSRANFHWTHCGASSETSALLFEHAGVDYLVRSPKEAICPFAHLDGLRLVQAFGSPPTVEVYALER